MDWKQMPGSGSDQPPEPLHPAHTRFFPAGAVDIGIEYRLLNPDTVRESYKMMENSEAILARFEEKIKETEPKIDEGLSIHVMSPDRRAEYLRFDCFAEWPHYHYIRTDQPGNLLNWSIVIDRVADGEPLDFALDRIRHRLPAMLTQARAADVAAQLDLGLVGKVCDDVRAHANDLVAARREELASAGAAS